MGKKTQSTSTDTTKTASDASAKTSKVAGAPKVAKTAGKKAARKAVSTPAAEIKFEFDRLPRAPLLRIIKTMAHKVDPEARVQAHVLDRFEQIIQTNISDLVKNTVLAAQKEKRKTIMVKDLDFIQNIMAGKQSGFSQVAASVDVAVAAPSTASSN